MRCTIRPRQPPSMEREVNVLNILVERYEVALDARAARIMINIEHVVSERPLVSNMKSKCRLCWMRRLMMAAAGPCVY